MNNPDFVIFVSGGNDSVALVAFAAQEGLKNVTVCFSDTGWASPEWPERIERFALYVDRCGFDFVSIDSEGFLNLAIRKKGFPANKPKFCTYELKIRPAMAWLDEIDPDKEAICMVGVRREESVARAQWPVTVPESTNHGGRELWSPLAMVREADRDALILTSGMPILPHRSRECSPCVNSNRADFRRLGESDIKKVEDAEMIIGKPMFRVQRFMGANGIREVIRWAKSDRGKYSPEPPECDSGMCGG